MPKTALTLTIFLVLVAVGLVILVNAFVSLVGDVQAMVSAAHVRGTVIDVQSTIGSDDGGTFTAYFPVIRFETISGAPIQFNGNRVANVSPYKIGDSIDVAYDPHNPSAAEEAGIGEIHIVDFAWGFMGFLFIAAAFTVYKPSRR